MISHPNDLKEWLKQCEGYSNEVYTDSVGKQTIGYGRNLSDNGISQDEAELMLDNDIKDCIQDLSQYIWYLDQPEQVQIALINMCFNLGLPRLLKFRKMIYYLCEKDYLHASIEALDSKWAKQVHGRAKDIAVMIREAKS